MHRGNVLDIRTNGTVACVFMEDGEKVFAFSMIFNKTWKFLYSSMADIDYKKRIRCWELVWELGINDSHLTDLTIERKYDIHVINPAELVLGGVVHLCY